MKESLLLAKIAALKKNFDAIEYLASGQCYAQHVDQLLPRYFNTIRELKSLNPELYTDIQDIEMPDVITGGMYEQFYKKADIVVFLKNLEYILELTSNIRIGDNVEKKADYKRVFITHGRSMEWNKIQNYLERDLGIATLELAQQPNLGRTVLEKLSEESNKCSVAVIVMTGDDITSDGEIRARENVMHEIGFFQGKYGFGNVVLLHEAGVNIPSNIHGLVYISFPKDTAEAAQGALTREFKVLFN